MYYFSFIDWSALLLEEPANFSGPCFDEKTGR